MRRTIEAPYSFKFCEVFFLGEAAAVFILRPPLKELDITKIILKMNTATRTTDISFRPFLPVSVSQLKQQGTEAA